MEMDDSSAAPAAGKSGGSGLTISLHPLVIINISDHSTRKRSLANGKPTRVLGILLGIQVKKKRRRAKPRHVCEVHFTFSPDSGQGNCRHTLFTHRNSWARVARLGFLLLLPLLPVDHVFFRVGNMAGRERRWDLQLFWARLQDCEWKNPDRYQPPRSQAGAMCVFLLLPPWIKCALSSMIYTWLMLLGYVKIIRVNRTPRCSSILRRDKFSVHGTKKLAHTW